MQRLEVSGAVRPIYGSLGVKRLRMGAAIFVLSHTPLFRVEKLFIVTLILSFHLRLGPPSGLFAFGFPNKPLQAFTFPPYV